MRVYWGSSYGRNVDVPHLLALLRFAHYCLERDVPLDVQPTYGDALMERSRGRSATRFLLDSQADVWLSVDSDIDFRPQDAFEICRQAERYDVVGGLYMTRSSRHGIPTSLLQEGQRYAFEGDPTPQPITYLATGFMAVHRRVFERLAQGLTLYHPKENLRHYDLFQTMAGESDGDPIKLSEDWAFCQRARSAGFGVYLNPAVRLTHYGSAGFVLEDLITKFPERQPLALTRTADGIQIEHEAEGPNDE